jgi:hypothetical protein
MEFKANQTFEDVKIAFNNLIGFNTEKSASFFMSDDNWKKGKEITSRQVSDEEAASIKQMKDAKLSDFIVDPHQKIYYVYDTEAQWCFHMELVKIAAPENGAVYPRCVKSTGDAPRQFGATVLGAVPEPEDFDEEAIAKFEEEEMMDEVESEDSVESPMDEGDELETANEDMMEDDTPEGEEYN